MVLALLFEYVIEPIVLVFSVIFLIPNIVYIISVAVDWTHHRLLLYLEPSNGLSPICLKKLPKFKFSDSDEDQINKCCVICIDEFGQGQSCRRLPPCGHVFHQKCVDSWLIEVATCPICRVWVSVEDKEHKLLSDKKL
ncbi:unnamed protein product [Cochlearia groenlandica]